MGPVEKVSVFLPKDLVEEIRRTVPEKEVSHFLEEAARWYLPLRRQARAIRIGFGAWRREAHPELSSAEDTTHYLRELRERDRKRVG